MWQSNCDVVLRRRLECDLCLPPQCLARLMALYETLVKFYNSDEGSLAANLGPTSFDHDPCKKMTGTRSVPFSKIYGSTGNHDAWRNMLPVGVYRPSNKRQVSIALGGACAQKTQGWPTGQAFGEATPACAACQCGWHCRVKHIAGRPVAVVLSCPAASTACTSEVASIDSGAATASAMSGMAQLSVLNAASM